MSAAHYDRRQLAEAIRAVGVRRGDVVFSHGNIGFFGFPAEGRTPDVVSSTILDAFRDVIGDEGTLVVPTFTYSFCKGEPFDVARTPSTCGAFTEWVRRHPDARRSREPIFSIAALGARATELTSAPPVECFGPGSFWDRFLRADGIVCNLNFDAGSTFIHFVERMARVPYRYDKLFRGAFIDGLERVAGSAIYFCRDVHNADTVPSFEPFDAVARGAGVARKAPVGKGSVVAIRAEATRALIERELPVHPWLLTVASKTGVTPVLQADRARAAALSPGTDLTTLVGAIHRARVDLHGDGAAAAFDALAGCVPLRVVEWPTGTRVGDALIAEDWTALSGSIATVDGRPVLSMSEGTLSVCEGSASCDRIVSREELLELLVMHPHRPDALPVARVSPHRRVAVGATRAGRERLDEPEYRLRVDVRERFGARPTGEVVPGASLPPSRVMVCATLDASCATVPVAVHAWLAIAGANRSVASCRFSMAADALGLAAHVRSLGADERPETLLLLGPLGLPYRALVEVPGESVHAFKLPLAAMESAGAAIVVADRDATPTPLRDLGVHVIRVGTALTPGKLGSPYPQHGSTADDPSIYGADELKRSLEIVTNLIGALPGVALERRP